MSELKQGNVRIIKINKEAVFELVYETLLHNLKEYFDINKPESAEHYCMDYETGEFIMIATHDKDFDKSLDINAKQLIKKFDITTESLYASKQRYIEISMDEMFKLQEN